MSTNERPSNCRNALKAAGKPYPRSGCAVCKTGGLMGCPYERGEVPKPESVATPQPPTRQTCAYCAVSIDGDPQPTEQHMRAAKDWLRSMQSTPESRGHIAAIEEALIAYEVPRVRTVSRAPKDAGAVPLPIMEVLDRRAVTPLCDHVVMGYTEAQLMAYGDAREAAANALIAECQSYLKDGETPVQRMERDHLESIAMMGLLAKAREAAGRADAVPDGYALVPAIPTEAMTDAYWRAVVLPDNARLSDRPKAVARWQAMLSAAPLPQHPPAEPAARAQVASGKWADDDFYSGHPLPVLHDDPATNAEVLIQALCDRLDTARRALADAAAMQVVQPALSQIKANAAWAMNETDPRRLLPRSVSYALVEAQEKSDPSPAHAGAGAEALAEVIANLIESHHPDFVDYMPCARDIARRLAGGDHEN